MSAARAKDTLEKLRVEEETIIESDGNLAVDLDDVIDIARDAMSGR